MAAVAPQVATAPPEVPEAVVPEVVVPEANPTRQSAKMAPSEARLLSVSSADKKPLPAAVILPASKQGLVDTAGVRAAPAARPSAPAVADEASLFHDGVVALRSGQPSRAVVLFDFHARLYPQGVLADERVAVRALALADLGRATEAHAAIDRFLQAHPTSPLAARLLARARLLDPAGAVPQRHGP